MDKHEMVTLIASVLDEARAGVLATVDSQCAPHMRWMTPGLLKERPDTLFMVTASQFAKIDQIHTHPYAEMIIQTAVLDRVFNIRGTIQIIDNPSLRTEVLESVGQRLNAFWKANKSEAEMVVLEMLVEEVTYYLPMKGTKLTVSFK